MRVPFGLVLIFLVSCTEKIELTESIETGSVNSVDMSESCHCDELVKDENELFTHNEELYTGTCFANYPDSENKYVERSYLKGKLHGKTSYYDKEGAVLAEEEYVEGVNTKSATDKFTACNCSDLEKKDAANGIPDRWFKNNSPFTGICYEYYPETDVIYIEINYREGVKHGATKYFDREGEQLFMEEYKLGELQNVTRPNE